MKRPRIANLFAVKLVILLTLAIAIARVWALSGDTLSDRELGQPDFFHNSPNYVDLDVMNAPGQIAIDRTATPNRLYVVDMQNNRVLGYASLNALVSGGPATLIIGQPDFFNGGCNTGGISRSTLCVPAAVAVDSVGDLFVADQNNSRVLEFNRPFATAAATGSFAGQPAAWVMGQLGNFTSNGCNFGCLGTGCAASEESLCGPSGVALDSANNLYVLDQNNNRVLEYDAPFNTAVGADRVFGQVDFNSRTTNRGGAAPSAVTLALGNTGGVAGVAVDPSGDLWVSDSGNSRVLEFITPLKATAVAGSGDVVADLVIGQAKDFAKAACNQGIVASAKTLCRPGGLTLDAARNLWVADSGNNRVLEYSTPVGADPSAHLVLGQSNSFTTNFCGAAISAGTLCGPAGVAVDSSGNVYVSDKSKNRLLKYTTPLSTDTIADLVLGQPDFSHSSPDTADASGENGPLGIAVDRSSAPNHLYVADTRNNRVLGYSSAASFINGGPANIVIGQRDFFQSGCNQSQTPSARTLCAPAAIAVDGVGNLFVADSQNSRILEFSKPFASGVSVNQAAILVIGQGGVFNTTGCNNQNAAHTATRTSLCNPMGVAVDAVKGALYVADTNNSRVLQYDPPFPVNPSPHRLFGQTVITASACNQGAGATASDLCKPRQLLVDASENLYVADTDDNRVLEYDNPLVKDTVADRVWGQFKAMSSDGCNVEGSPASGFPSANNLCSPQGVAMDPAGDLYIADSRNNRVLEFNRPIALYNTTANRVFGQGNTFTANGCNIGGHGPSSATLCGPGMVAADIKGNVYISDTGNNRVTGYDAPLPTPTPTHTPTPKPT